MTQEKISIGALLASELDSGTLGTPDETVEIAVNFVNATAAELAELADKFGG
jgi:hypothetical protein